MAEYHRIEHNVQAVQWHRVGNPRGAIFPGDPREVRLYKREGVDNALKCFVCMRPMAEHGEMELLAPPIPSPLTDDRVDPVSGKHYAAAVPAYPKEMVKEAKQHAEPPKKRTVHNVEEEKKALSEGFVLVDRHAAPADPTSKEVWPNEGTYSKDFTKDPVDGQTFPTRSAKNSEEEKAALADGYTQATHGEHKTGDAPKDDPGHVYKEGLGGGHPYSADRLQGDPAPSSYPQSDGPPDFEGQPFRSIDLGGTSRAAVEPGYPRTLKHVDGHASDREVHNRVEYDQAAKDGYVTTVVIHPGYYIVKENTGQVGTEEPTGFPHKFRKSW